MSQKEFYEGKGSRSIFFKSIMELNPATIPDLGRKLKLVTGRDFMGMKLYNDKMCQVERVNKKTLRELWLHCCRRNNVVTLD